MSYTIPMKTLTRTICLTLALLFSGITFGVTVEELMEQDGLYYKKFTNVPFTGNTTGQEQGIFKNGKKEGDWVSYHDNGQLDGKWTEWDENGQIKSEKNYKDGECIRGDCD